jgi:hypothetical protein
MIPRSTTPATVTLAPALGAPSQPRQRLAAADAPSNNPISSDSGAYAALSASDSRHLQPASPVGDAWRGRAVELAQRHGWSREATWLGRSARGVERYRVASQRHADTAYVVTHQAIGAASGMQTMLGGGQQFWQCVCPRGAWQQPCTHAGAAILLAAYRGEVVEARAAALALGMRWALARNVSGTADGGRFYQVSRSPERIWDEVRVLWDTRPGRDVPRWCSCEQIACPHIGTVALRRAHDAEAQALERAQVAQFGETPWEWLQSAAL